MGKPGSLFLAQEKIIFKKKKKKKTFGKTVRPKGNHRNDRIELIKRKFFKI